MRILATLAAMPLLVGSLCAQCLDTTGGAAVPLVPLAGFTADDEGVSAPVDMLLGAAGFPMAGAIGGPLTHAVVDSNGALYLTSGGAAVGRVDFGPIDVDDLRGIAGDSPRVFSGWNDLEGPLATWAVNVDTSVAGRFKVTWIDVQQFFGTATPFSMSISLFDTGVCELSYSDLPTLGDGFDPVFAGISIGNGVGTGAEVSADLTTGPDSGALGLLFQAFNGLAVPSVARRTITLVPNGLGGYTSVLTCDPGVNAPFGAGCYGESVYQVFADAAAASAALQGNAMLLVPNSTGYVANWAPGAAAALFLPTGAAASLPTTDDGSTTITPTIALPIPGGTAPTLTIEHNGNIILGGTANHAFDFTPTAAEFAAASAAGFYSWHDYNDTEAGSGTIKTEEVVVGADTVLVVTWDGVENYSTPAAANPSTIQFQLNLTTGTVTLVWLTVDADASSEFGSAHLVGYNGPGAGADGGSFPFATAGSTTTIDGLSALALSASPDPMIGVGGSSNLITYTVDNMPDYAPPAGVRLGILFFSVLPAPGIDLGLIGAPGCQTYVGTLDIQFPIAVLGGASQSVPITFPPPLSVGLSFFSQAVALIPSGSLPGGLNAFGLLTSNGLETRF